MEKNMSQQDQDLSAICKEVQELHECLDSHREEVRADMRGLNDDVKLLQREIEAHRKEHAEHSSFMEKYFIGMDPSQHIADHLFLQKDHVLNEKRSDMKRNIITSIFVAVVVGVLGWAYTNGMTTHEELTQQKLLEEIRKELKLNTPPIVEPSVPQQR